MSGYRSGHPLGELRVLTVTAHREMRHISVLTNIGPTHYYGGLPDLLSALGWQWTSSEKDRKRRNVWLEG